MAKADAKITWHSEAQEDLTNAQFPMLNSHPKGEASARVRAPSDENWN
jgi:hypothetical protein